MLRLLASKSSLFGLVATLIGLLRWWWWWWLVGSCVVVRELAVDRRLRMLLKLKAAAGSSASGKCEANATRAAAGDTFSRSEPHADL